MGGGEEREEHDAVSEARVFRFDSCSLFMEEVYAAVS